MFQLVGDSSEVKEFGGYSGPVIRRKDNFSMLSIPSTFVHIERVLERSQGTLSGDGDYLGPVLCAGVEPGGSQTAEFGVDVRGSARNISSF